MCTLYSITTNVEAIRAIVREFRIDAARIGNFPPLPGLFPDMFAPIIRNRDGYRELTMVRWGMPSSSRALYEAAQRRARKLRERQGRELTPQEFSELVKLEPDRGTHNVRNVDSMHWQRWLAPEFRCVVPFNSFAEFDSAGDGKGGKLGNTWYAYDQTRPLAFFAGIWAPRWTSVRKVKEGIITTDLFAFLTTEPNAEVRPVNPDAMPVILTTPEEIETWLTAPWEEARKLQRPLPDGVLQVVSVGPVEDPPPPEDETPGDPEPSLF